MALRAALLPLIVMATPAVAQDVVVPAPAPAAQIEENEALVMRVIFEECLGYLRHARVPFQTLETAPLAVEGVAELGLSAKTLEKAEVLALFPPRYAVAWGDDGLAKFCMITTPLGADGVPQGVGRLGVRVEGFIPRLTERAKAEGLPFAELAGEDFSPLNTSLWSEAEADGPNSTLGFTVLPTQATADGAIADAGLIAASAPSTAKAAP